MKIRFFALAAVAVCAAGTAQATTLAYNSAPADGWFYGSGNDYSPANTAVLTTDANDQLYLRLHKTFVVAPASTGKLYSFALGTTPLSFDWGIDNNQANPITALLTLTNMRTGSTFSYDPFFVGNDNEVGNGSAQNSFRLNWVPGGFFDPNISNIYRVRLDVDGLAGGAQSLTVDARLGTGAIPEPATWAMMIGGLGFVGGALRHRRRTALRLTAA